MKFGGSLERTKPPVKRSSGSGARLSDPEAFQRHQIAARQR